MPKIYLEAAGGDMNQPHAIPVFNPNAEARAMQALNAVMMLFQTALRPIGPEELVDLHQSLAHLVDCLFPIEGNTADFAGSAPLAGGHYVHPVKTAEAAVLLGRTAGLPRSRLITLATAAALMNVGYLQLKQSLIDEPRNLMDAEWEQQMHAHPAHSVAALTASGLPHEAVVAIGQHHERWDGSGYPHGARGKDISIEAQIVAIADTFIAVRSSRPHRPAAPAERALAIISDGAGTLYEPGLAAAFVDTIRAYAARETTSDPRATSSASRADEDAAPVQREEAQPLPHDTFVAPVRDAADDADEIRTPVTRVARERTGETRVSPPPQAVAVPSRRAPPPVAAAAPPPVPAAARARDPRARRPSRRRSLFSTEVYLRSR